MYNTRLYILILGLFAGLSNGYISMEIKQPTNGVNVGYWGAYEVCGGSEWVRAFSVKSDGTTSTFQDAKVDRVGVTGITFYCNTVTGHQITSSVANGGSYYPSRSCGGSLIKGLQINVNPSQSPDALGVEDVRVVCLDGSMIEGLFGTVTASAFEIEELLKYAEEDDEEEVRVLEQFHPRKVVPAKRVPMGKLNDAYWGTGILCTSGLFLCGLQTRIDQSFAAEKTFSDLRGLTDIMVFCCN